MMRLGLYLSLHSGRTALTRLLATTAAVGIGVALLLSVAAMYHGYQTTIDRACWACTGRHIAVDSPTPQPILPSTQPANNAELWRYSEDFYQGRIIERADVAALGPHAPAVPGTPRAPKAGEYFASPALASLIASVPRDELGDRFSGALVGLIGPAGLSGPDDLAIVVGHAPADLASPADALRITKISTTPEPRGDTVIYRFGFALGGVALLLPMLMLIGNATRLAAARREERFAAMRLVGASPRQVNVIASVDAVVGALLGSVLGIGLSRLLEPLAARITITGSRFFPAYVMPTAAEYMAVLVGVPVAAALVTVLSLRRVRISPLGVTRRVTPPAPRGWRVVPLAVGMVVFIVPLTLGDPGNPGIGLASLGLALIMVGLVNGGGWLTMRTAYALARLRPGPASLLAARRMADNPRTTFRSISGLVLAVFVGTVVASVVPAALAAQQAPDAATLNQVMRLFPHGPVEHTAAGPGGLLDQLRAFPGVAVLPVHSQLADGSIRVDDGGGPPPGIIACADLAPFGAIGHCAPGQSAVQAQTESMSTDNLAFLDRALPLVRADSPPYASDPNALPVDLVLIKVDSAAMLERIRTFLAVAYPGLTGGTGSAPQTFGEVAAVRGALYSELGNVMVLVVGLTLLVAGSGLTIAVGGAVLDRRRPFTLLRVGGTPSAVLRRVVLLEALLPLVSATIVAALVGIAASMPINRVLSPPGGGTTLHLPDSTYYLTVAAGLAISVAVVAATMPVLNRVTGPASARFE